MQSPSLGSGNRFSCLSGQFQESKETDQGLRQGLQSSEKGLLPPSTEKSLRLKKKKKAKRLVVMTAGISFSQAQASFPLWDRGLEAQDLQFHSTRHGVSQDHVLGRWGDLLWRCKLQD